MANSETIKTTIDANINTNGNQAITGAVLNSVLKQMVDSTDAQLTELSEKVNELDKGEAYIMGDTLTFRNWADASIEGETLKL